MLNDAMSGPNPLIANRHVIEPSGLLDLLKKRVSR